MRDYGRIHSAFWSSPTIRALSEDGRTLALYLMSSPHSTIAGVFRLPDGYASEDLSWGIERVREGFRDLQANGFATRCEGTKWVWVTKHFEWNPPENPNQVKAASKLAVAVPEECSWKAAFIGEHGALLGIRIEIGTNPCATLSEPLPNQEQEQEQEEETVPPAVLAARSIPDCPHRELIALFVSTVPELPKPRVEMWSGKNADAMRSRWQWVLKAKRETGQRYATTAEEAVAWFGKFFEAVAGSDFLTGRNGKFSGCHLGWLMTQDNFTKVVQGNYENRKAA